jgi:hypothetical protein
MSLYTFCPLCEEKTLTGLSRRVINGRPETELIVISCGKCDKVLNYKRWARVERVESKGNEVTGWALKFYHLLPRPLFTALVGVMIFFCQGYLVKTSTNDGDLPEIIESYFTQIERLSSLPYDGLEPDETYIRRATQKIVEAYPHV